MMAHSLKDRRIVLIGLSGAGKSSSGNTILGSDHFKSDCGFDSVSTETVSESAAVEGRWVTVVDTAGFTSTDTDEDQVCEKFEKITEKCDPGPHVFVFVVRIGRMSREDSILLKSLSAVFVYGAAKCTMVLFTHGDKLRHRSVDELIKSSRCVRELVSKCGGRHCVFDNKQRGNRQQVRRFLDTVDEIVEANRGRYWELLVQRYFDPLHIAVASVSSLFVPLPHTIHISFYRFCRTTQNLDSVYKEVDG